MATLVGQRIFGIALGYEDVLDHDDLRHDPMMAVLAGKLEARRKVHPADIQDRDGAGLVIAAVQTRKPQDLDLPLMRFRNC